MQGFGDLNFSRSCYLLSKLSVFYAVSTKSLSHEVTKELGS